MIKVEERFVTVEGSIPEIVTDIYMVVDSVKDTVSDEEYKAFLETLIWGIFERNCTESEVSEIMQGYERFRAFKEKLRKSR